MSVDIAITSAWIHIPQVTERGKRSRHELRQVAVGDDPSFADRYWISIAIRFASQHDPQQQVAELRAALDVGGEVAGST